MSCRWKKIPTSGRRGSWVFGVRRRSDLRDSPRETRGEKEEEEEEELFPTLGFPDKKVVTSSKKSSSSTCERRGFQ